MIHVSVQALNELEIRIRVVKMKIIIFDNLGDLENRMAQKLLSAHYKLKCITIRCQKDWIISQDQV